jgi:hypothetical protein
MCVLSNKCGDLGLVYLYRLLFLRLIIKNDVLDLWDCTDRGSLSVIRGDLHTVYSFCLIWVSKSRGQAQGCSRRRQTYCTYCFCCTQHRSSRSSRFVSSYYSLGLAPCIWSTRLQVVICDALTLSYAMKMINL